MSEERLILATVTVLLHVLILAARKEPNVDPHLLGSDIDLDNGIHMRGSSHHIQKWPNGVIPVVLNVGNRSDIIRSAIFVFQNVTCLRFVEKNNSHIDYIEVKNSTRNFSSVGKKGGRQFIELSNFTANVIRHEFFHTVGFHHQHQSIYRDEFVTIIWDNIATGHFTEFSKVGGTENLGKDYDFHSLSHFFPNTHSKNGKPTIVPKGNQIIMPSTSLTKQDADKIRKMYGCPNI